MNIPKQTCYLVKEPGHTKSFVLDSANDALKLLVDELHADKEPVENVWCLYLNAQRKVIGYEHISRGTLTTADAAPALVYRGAILANAFAIVLSHNHPSGQTKISTADKKVTERIIEAGKIIGIPLVDHIIIGENRTYTSMAEEGCIF